MSDPFHIRGDYIKGMLYEVRRKYLNSDNDNNLVPPQDFMTKKQARTALKVRRDDPGGGVTLNSILVFKNQSTTRKTDDGLLLPVKKQEGHKKNIKRKPAVIMIEKFSSTNRNDWKEQLQAGCNVWINHATGEVSDVCPWHFSDDEEGEELVLEEDFTGTGSIVYDNEEFSDFMDNLDRLAESPKSSTRK